MGNAVPMGVTMYQVCSFQSTKCTPPLHFVRLPKGGRRVTPMSTPPVLVQGTDFSAVEWGL